MADIRLFASMEPLSKFQMVRLQMAFKFIQIKLTILKMNTGQLLPLAHQVLIVSAHSVVRLWM